jgi:hypothetical protein
VSAHSGSRAFGRASLPLLLHVRPLRAVRGGCVSASCAPGGFVGARVPELCVRGRADEREPLSVLGADCGEGGRYNRRVDREGQIWAVEKFPVWAIYVIFTQKSVAIVTGLAR